MWPIRPPRWVGREHELAVLRAAAEALGRGEGTAVWIEGEPGIGKSALVAEALAVAGQPEWDVGWAGADQLTGQLPLRVMQDCLQVRPSSPDPRRAHAASLLSGRRMGPLADADASVNGIEVLLSLADELCAAAPTVLVVDDLQWADEASLAVWHQLATSISQLRLLLIGTCRPTPRRQVTGWLVATQARLRMTGEARATLQAIDDERAVSGEIANARAVVCLADGDPAAALAAVRDVLAGTAPVIGYVTMVEARLIAGLAYRELGDQRAANQAAECALALAEADRLVLPFAMTGSRDLLEALPRHETAHAALRADILDVLQGASVPVNDDRVPEQAEELSPGELKVLRYLPTNLSRPEIAAELSVSVNTVSTHIRSIYAKLQVTDRSSAVQRARELGLLAPAR
jgi:ATP/maltotriose-dependent transcriptional regulator MalT